MKYKIETYIDDKGIEHIKIPPKLLQEKARNGGMIYLGEFLDYLPHNSFIWKSVTGCGATTLALNDNSNCIIALPTRQTVQSKWVKRDKENKIIGYDTEILCVYGGLNNRPEAIIKYINKRMSEDAPVKIVCTYDQVEFIVMTMTGKRWVNGEYVQSQSKDAMCFSFDTYRLYIDEVHQVLDDYADRDRREKINGMLKCLKLFSDVTCITATPLEMDEIMDEFKHLPIVKIDFPAMEVRKEDIKTRYPAETCTKIVKDYLDGVNFGNAHIFVNSVDFILKVVSNVAKDRNMTTGQIYDSIKIVCGDTELNKGKILNRITKLSDERIMKNITKDNLALEMDEILINFPAKRFSGGYYNTSVNIFNQVIENHDSQALSDLIEEKVSRMQRFVYDETGGKNERPKYDCYRDDDEYENMEEFDEGISGTGWDLTDAYIP